MLVPMALLSLMGALITFTSATALTYKLAPNEKECFYTYVAKPGAKIAFYFAVQSGGSFDGMHNDSRSWVISADVPVQLIMLCMDRVRRSGRTRSY